MLYLDNAATTFQKPLCVYTAMDYYTRFCSANAGRGGHRASIAAAEKINDTAEQLAELFNIDNPMQIAFTPNATYALNMAILGTVQNAHTVLTCMEHNSVLRPVDKTCSYTMVGADKNGYVNPADMEKAIRYDTKLIICTHVSNVCGVIQPIEEIGAIAKKHNIPFLVDTAQGAGSVDIDVKKCNISMLVFSGHKGLMGPMGTGGIYVNENAMPEPVITGGTGSQSEKLSQPDFMPDMLHSGTLNTPAIAALGTSVDFIKKHGVNNILAHERELTEILVSELKNMNGVKIYGADNISIKNGTTAFNIDNISSGEVSDILSSEYNIAVRGGWHCAYYAHKALGSEKEGAVRVSFGFFNKKADVYKLIDAVNRIMKR